jgi:hypothetical protein
MSFFEKKQTQKYISTSHFGYAQCPRLRLRSVSDTSATLSVRYFGYAQCPRLRLRSVSDTSATLSVRYFGYAQCPRLRLRLVSETSATLSVRASTLWDLSVAISLRLSLNLQIIHSSNPIPHNNTRK